MSRPALKLTAPASAVTLPLAEHAAALRYEDLPEAVLRVARHCLLDWFGVTLAGSATDTAGILREACLDGAAPAPGPATLVGGPGRSSCANAALINGIAGHALDYDDVHYAMPGHPTAAIAPALLAVAERDGISGRDLLGALVAGVEVACRTGLFMTRDHYLRGWHATGTLGAFGAAAAVSRALGLDARTTALALGITATQTGGLKSMFGSMCKPLHAGKAAANGLLAAQLAARGFSAREDALECEQGYGEVAAAATDPQAALAGLGENFQIADVLFKYHAACYGTHASIEATRQLLRVYDLAPDQIEAIELSVPLRNLRVCNIANPTTGLEAKFSLRMTCAMALCGESTAAIGNFTDALCRKPALTGLLDKITVIGAKHHGDGTCELKARLSDGSTHLLKGDVGSPNRDLADQEQRLLHKYQALSRPILGLHLSEDLAGMILELDSLKDIRSLMALTRS